MDGKKDEPSRIEMSEGELEELIREIRSTNLSEPTQEVLIKLLVGWRWLNLQLERKSLSIKKLLKLFFGSKTEKDPTSGKPGKLKADKKGSDKQKPKGHGKNGQSQYPNAERIKVPHEELKVGDLCPSCERGKLYLFGYGSVLRIFGQPPLIAKIYEPEKLRCSSCLDVVTAALPAGAVAERYHPSAKAMVGIFNYSSGVPFYRLEGLQRQLGFPLSDSTQFDMAEDLANAIRPVYGALEKKASDGEIFKHDDTGMKILSLLKENKTFGKKERRGMQTTGLIAQCSHNKIALYYTGRLHAGENLENILKQRPKGLGPPIQMADALSANFDHEFKELVLKALCMDHGRRQFFEILDEFPTECRYVIEELSEIYKHEAFTKENNFTARERLEYHQIHSSPVMNEINTWMEEKVENNEAEPNGPLGKAIAYFLTHWNGLTAFLRIEGAPLSNAEVEQLLKRCVLRRKASMFYKTQVGAWIGDVIMSVIETARVAGQNPFEYLVALQRNNPRVRANPELWLPWNYQQTLATL